jgi:peptidoglycan/xylan/chitin deacetylase (PgdA/CDA1 family)
MALLSSLSPVLLGMGAAYAAAYTVGAHFWALSTPHVIRRGPRRTRAVALTFDDGPHPVFTPRMLDVLARAGVHATFFLIGRAAERFPHLVRSIVDGGHEVGNHTYRHRPLWLLPPRRTREEIEHGASTLASLTGRLPRYFRPPWGQLNLEAYRHTVRRGVRPVLWSLRPEGWLPLAHPNGIVQAVARRLHPGAILNLHDGGGIRDTPARTAQALPALLALLRAHGYRCLTLSALLSDGDETGAAGAR